MACESLDSAPVRFVNEVTINATPERVFEVLEDFDAWPEWFNDIVKVEWTSPRPFGVGTIRNADLQNLPLGNLSAVFITHFHSDYISDPGEANFWSLAMGRSKALEVFGPEGIKDVVDGYNLACKFDTSYRIVHHGADIFPPDAYVSAAKTVRVAEAGGAELFFDRNGLKADAFRVGHSPFSS